MMKTSEIIPQYLTPKQAARYLNVSESWLAHQRCDGRTSPNQTLGPPYYRVGGIRYSRQELDEYLVKHCHCSCPGEDTLFSQEG